MRRSGAVNGVRESDPEGQLLGPAAPIEHVRQSRMRRRVGAKLTEIIGIAGHNDPVLDARAGARSALPPRMTGRSWSARTATERFGGYLSGSQGR